MYAEHAQRVAASHGNVRRTLQRLRRHIISRDANAAIVADRTKETYLDGLDAAIFTCVAPDRWTPCSNPGKVLTQSAWSPAPPHRVMPVADPDADVEGQLITQFVEAVLACHALGDMDMCRTAMAAVLDSIFGACAGPLKTLRRVC